MSTYARRNLVDAVFRCLKNGNYRPTEQEILKLADVSPAELVESYGSLLELLRHVARTGSSEVLRHCISGGRGGAVWSHEAGIALAWVLLTGRRMRPNDRRTGG